MSRRKIRELIFKMIFRVDFHAEEERTEQLALFLDAVEHAAENDDDAYAGQGENERPMLLRENDRVYMERKVQDIFAHLTEIDGIIDSSAQGWKTSRMAKVELSLIRLAVYEMRFEEEIPTGVAINEAVELAKIYGEDNSPSFVNGVLARIA